MRCSLANWCQLLIGQLDVNFLLANWMSTSYWPIDVSFSLVNWCQLHIGQLTSASHWPNDVSCSSANWCQLLIGQLTSAAHWPTDVSHSFPNCTVHRPTELLVCQLKSYVCLWAFTYSRNRYFLFLHCFGLKIKDWRLVWNHFYKDWISKAGSWWRRSFDAELLNPKRESYAIAIWCDPALMKCDEG